MYDLIVEYLKININLFTDFDEVYIFGSLIKQKEYIIDIDILLIYSPSANYINGIVKSINKELSKTFDVPFDFTVLTKNELNDTDFLNKINDYVKIK